MALTFFKIYDHHTDFPQVFNHTKVIQCSTYTTDESMINFFYQLAVRIGKPLVFRQDTASGSLQLNHWTKELNGASHADEVAVGLRSWYGHYSFDANAAFLFCLENNSEGGDIYFVDADVIAATLKEKDAALFEKVQQVKIKFGNSNDVLVNNEDFILQSDEMGWKINWNYELAAKSNNELAVDFKKFLDQDIEKSMAIKSIRLNPGEGVFWHDRRVLVGKGAFVGNRKLYQGAVVKKIPNHLWKYINSQEIGVIEGVERPTGHLQDAKKLLQQVQLHAFDKRLF